MVLLILHTHTESLDSVTELIITSLLVGISYEVENTLIMCSDEIFNLM